MEFFSYIFLTTIFSIFIILFYSTFVGRLAIRLFPKLMQEDLNLYIAPILGIAITLLFVAALGRYFAFSDSIIFPILFFTIFVISALTDKDLKNSLQFSVSVGFFGILSCSTILSSIYFIGALNPHNDTFTYLAQSDWLQFYSFNELVKNPGMTHASTQIAMYQNQGFRMGGTYLLGLYQSILNIRWAFDIYPAVVGVSVAASCLAVGYPAASYLNKLPAWARYSPLLLIANSLGGTSFAAYYGFMPQGFGIMFGAGFLFIFGKLLSKFTRKKMTIKETLTISVPMALLLSASIFSYSEFSPFLLLSILLSGFIIAFFYRSAKIFSIFIISLILISCILLNVEIVRSIRALSTQSTAVVGSPIDWPPLGYLAHALGVHGGGWDLGQWTKGLTDLYFGFVAIAIILIFIVLTILFLRKSKVERFIELIPTMIMVGILSLGILYFRYFAANPFQIGIGQSWSQFKLSDWAHLFVSSLIVILFMSAIIKIAHVKLILSVVIVFSIILGVSTGFSRSRSLMSYYKTNNISEFLRSFREILLKECDGQKYYIALDGSDHKFRQLLALYLADQYLKSDWRGDGYIENFLPTNRLIEDMEQGDCLVGKKPQLTSELDHVFGIAHFRSILSLENEIRLNLKSSVNELETDGKNWWIWLSKSAIFDVKAPVVKRGHSSFSKFSFSAQTKLAQTVVVIVHKKNGDWVRMETHLTEGYSDNSLLIKFPPAEIDEIVIEAMDEPNQISKTDTRNANFMLKNFILSHDRK